MDNHTQPLTSKQKESAKALFIEFHGTLNLCACVDCPLQLENRCSYQFDVYNTIDDFCLMEK